jgi:V8-like Glu-specific endopeptidase
MKSICCNTSTLIAVTLALTIPGRVPAFGQIAASETIDEAYSLVSDRIDNSTTGTLSVSVGSVHVPGAAWIRVHIGEYHLGPASYLTLIALDGQEQRFDAKSLADWYQWSAIFNGDEVEINLHMAPGDTGVYVQIDRVVTSEPLDPASGDSGQVASICNDFDDRGGSNDPAVARMRIWNQVTGTLNTNGSCTAWLVSNGAVLSAGHCMRGGIPAGSVIEFNVPASLANGANVAASANDQYPINVGSVMAEDNGRGEDWMVFAVNPNSTTGVRAHIAQGFFFMTKAGPPIDTTLRVTGYGLDNIPAGPGGAGASCCDADGDGTCEFNCNSTSQTQQTTTGRLDDLDGSIIEHDVDTMPANSGSPIIWEEFGLYTIGIHTAGGCDDFVDGYNNHGTRFNRGPLESALQNFLGPNTVYVDSYDSNLSANGGVFQPLRTVTAAVAAVPDNGIIGLVPGNYPRAAGNVFTAGADGKAMTFIAPVGGAVIGN